MAAQTGSHLELHALATGLSLQSSVGETGTGLGLRAVWILSDNLGVEAEGAYFPENPQGNYGQTLVVAGARAGVKWGRLGVFAKARPGVLHLGGSAFRLYNGSSMTRAALEFGIALVYDITSHLLIRADAGETAVFFGDAPITRPLLDSVVMPGTTWNRHGTLAIGLRL